MVKPSLPHHGPSKWNDDTDRSTLPIHGTTNFGYREGETKTVFQSRSVYFEQNSKVY